MPTSLTRKPRLNLDFRGRGYVFTVVTLAAFALALVAFRPRAQFHVLESVVEYYPGRRVSADGYSIEFSAKAAETVAAEVQQQLRSPQVVQPAVVEAESRLGKNPETIRSVDQRLFVRLERQEDGPSQLRIRYLSKHSDFGRAFLDAITARFVEPRMLVDERASTAADQQGDQYAFAKSTLQEWQQECQQLQTALDELQRRELNKLRDRHEANHAPPAEEPQLELSAPEQSLDVEVESASAGETPSETEPLAETEGPADPSAYPATTAPLLIPEAGTVAVELEPTPGALATDVPNDLLQLADEQPDPEPETVVESFDDQPQPNPRWLELHDELAVAQHRAHQMLQTYTPEHPFVRQLLTEVEAIRQKLQATPRVIEPIQSPVQLVAPKPQSAETVQRIKVPQPIVPFDDVKARQTIESSHAYQQLRSQLDNALAKRDEAQAHLSNLAPPQRPRQAQLDPEVESARLLQPARQVDTDRLPVSPIRLLSMLVPAGLLGGVLAACRWRTPTPEFLCSREDVQRSLELPEVGSVRLPEAPPFELPTNPTPQFVFAGLRVAEAVLVVVVVLICVGLVTLPEFARSFTSNPFDAFGIGLDHIESFFTSFG